MKYRVGRKQKRAILDENGHEVAILHKGKEEVAQQLCDLLNGVNENDLLPRVSGSLPSDEEFETALEKEAFRVPYDGSNNFYDEPTLKHWRKCWEWVKNAVSNDR